MADLNGDGHKDLFTGCYGGVVYVMYGEGERRFGEPEILMSLTGDPLCLGEYYDKERKARVSLPSAKYPEAQMLSVSPVDWDADGDLDLVAGELDGRIFLLENDGSVTEPEFRSEPQKIKAGRKSLWVKSGHAMPVAADWDGDGLFDIVSGSDNGAVFYWRNTGVAGEPAFAKPVVLIDEPGSSDPTGPMTPARSRTRTQPHIADLDGDGRVELLVGESRRVMGADGKTKLHGLVWAHASPQGKK